ncbi:tyrosine--tRNA ligase [Staphylococcus epidermidis]|jgi:tyrosine--tRNA ligase|uniref:tyrosine--tRNA ligase n=1 Tax=Bacillota TaxID=1239 RepID=UPI00024E18AF|nr:MULTISPECIES: tyrosine--tRNA ligase [Bacillota]MDU4448902.1 tyrosine--tRNA ligase [Staphylococcus lugdunensis]EHS01802.1 tyrosine--tRNA ligase [Staphylococcus epidermidis VCU127]EJE17371.1 tyrosine--tRNA ligase [Staphylococcus epidermidis NIHLM015]EKC81839.1 tyrosyl-tRNA ligase [Staphylococcus epidermidis AU12-03]MBM0756311.1 tyrosine--tRNA ligase [Staphylococcus epidermidis]
MNIIDELQWRDAINQQTNEEGLRELIENNSISLYCGVDPTGGSMHIGHLIPFMMMKRFQLAGHKPFILIGGATGTIGDPSGRTSERTLQTLETVQKNVESLSSQMKKLFGKDANVTIVNNYDWLSSLTLLDFLRSYGKDFNINTMLAKDIVASRLDKGISFTEFAYQILQSIDFLHLFKSHNVQLQIGGADQWGNITSGLDLIRKKEGTNAEVFGLTIPLMLKADGTKFGKTAGGAIWLDPKRTSPYEFYQFWLNQDDRDVIKYLKFFTFLDKEEIDFLEEKVKNEPEKREAQKRLAEEVTKFVHDETALQEAQKITQALFSGNVKDLTVKEIEQGLKNMPSFNTTNETKNIVDWLVEINCEPSKRQAREDVINGAININGEKITDINFSVNPNSAFEGKYIIIRKGKRNYFLVKVL